MIQRQRSVLICSFIYLTSFGTVTSGAGIILKFACQGDSIAMFQNITFNSYNTTVTLYIRDEIDMPIVIWSMVNSTLISTFQMGYEGKLYIDNNGTLFMHNVHPWDQRIYVIQYQIDTMAVKYEVQLHVMVAPDKNCRPKIMHVRNVLTATLDADSCGTPLPALYWKEYNGVSNRRASVLQLQPRKETGTYYACIEGPALQCARNSKIQDYCSSINIGGNDSPTEPSDIWDTKTVVIMILGIFLISLFLAVISEIIIRKFGRRITENKQRKEDIPLLESSQQQKEQFVSDADKPNLSLKRRFSGRTHDNSRKCWLLDLVLNPDDDLIVTDGENDELKKFSLEGVLKSKLSFETRPDCLALTDGYLAMVTFPHETVLRVIDTRDELSVVSIIPFRSQCAGIGTMKDGRLIICNRESKSVIVCSKDGEILQEIKTGSSGETLFRKPSYVRVVDSRTIYVSDYRTEEFFIININDDNTFTINKHQINYPRTSCIVDGMLLVASSNIRLFTLDGNEAGEVTLNGVHHVRGLAFSEGKRLLLITHQSDGGDEVISVYEVMKH